MDSLIKYYNYNYNVSELHGDYSYSEIMHMICLLICLTVTTVSLYVAKRPPFAALVTLLLSGDYVPRDDRDRGSQLQVTAIQVDAITTVMLRYFSLCSGTYVYVLTSQGISARVITCVM